MKNAHWLFPVLSLVWFIPVLCVRNPPVTAVLLDMQEDGVTAELRVPLEALEIAFTESLADAPSQVLAQYRDALSVYILGHVTASSPNGASWIVEVEDMRVVLNERPLELNVRLSMRPPPGESVRKFDLDYDVVAREVNEHVATISLRQDWMDTTIGRKPAFIGMIRSRTTTVSIDRSANFG